MTTVNQCDIHCPVKAMMAAKYRIAQEQATSLFATLTNAVDTGLRGVSQAARSGMTCPNRNMPEGQWHASQACIAEAQAMADATDVTRPQLTAHEQQALEGVRLRDDPSALGK